MSRVFRTDNPHRTADEIVADARKQLASLGRPTAKSDGITEDEFAELVELKLAASRGKAHEDATDSTDPDKVLAAYAARNQHRKETAGLPESKAAPVRSDATNVDHDEVLAQYAARNAARRGQ